MDVFAALFQRSVLVLGVVGLVAICAVGVFLGLRNAGFFRRARCLLHAFFHPSSSVGWLCCVPLALALIVMGSEKSGGGDSTNDPPSRLSAPRRILRQSFDNVVTSDDVVRGYRIAEVSEMGGITGMPEGATTNEPLRSRGGFDWVFRVAPDGWRFPYRDGFLDGVTVVARGEVRPDVGTRYFPIPITNGVSLLPETRWNLIPNGEASVFSHVVTEGGSLLLNWRNALVGRDPTCPTNFQMELYRDGSFVWRTDGESRFYLPVFPFDWDGDGLENSVDPDPLVGNPADAHGANSEWYGIVCSNIFENVGGTVCFMEDVNSNAYYFAQVIAEDGPVPIRFDADRDSRLGSPVVVALPGETNRVPLLIGVEYAVTSTVPLSVTVPDSMYAVVTTNGVSEYTIRWPLEFNVQVSNGGHAVAVTPVPYDPGGTFIWSPEGENLHSGVPMLQNVPPSGCSYSANGGCVAFHCSSGTCVCHGCPLGGTFRLERMNLTLPTIWCGCWYDDPDEDPEPTPVSHSDMASAPSVTVSFSDPIVIFEDAYTNALDNIVDRQSSETTLTISAYGGLNGAFLNVTAANVDEKLEKTGGPNLPTSRVRIPANSDVTYEIVYKGKMASGNANDIKVTATLTAINDMSPPPLTSRLTVVRVAIRPEHVTGSVFRNRHRFGACERVLCESWPSSVSVCWSSGACGTTKANAAQYLHEAPFAAQSYNLVALVEGVRFPRAVESIFPEAVKAFNDDLHVVTVLYSAANANEAGWVGMELPVYCAPTNVYFGQIDVKELEATGVPTGYFSSSAWNGGVDHQGNALSQDWLTPDGDANYFGDDEASIPGCPPQWGSGGTLTWNIPNVCRAVVGQGLQEHVYSHSVQRFDITSNGVVEVTKFGVHVRRNPGQGELPIIWRNDEN